MKYMISFTFIDWFRQSILNTPSSSYSGLNSTCFYSKYFRPSRKGFCLISKSNKFTISFVSSLFIFIRPFTVFWRIISININSINTQFWFICFSHIFIKFFKRIFPSSTYFNTSFSIYRIRIGTWKIASVDHVSPHTIKSCFAHAVRFSRMILRTITTTRLAFTKCNIFRNNNLFCSTVTLGNPFSITNMFNESPPIIFFTF